MLEDEVGFVTHRCNNGDIRMRERRRQRSLYSKGTL